MSDNKLKKPASSNNNIMGGGPMGSNMSGEKAKDFKGSAKKLLVYLKADTVRLIIVVIFAIGSAALTIFGPKQLGKATDVLITGLTDKMKGGTAGIDFDKIASILTFILALYLISAIFSYIQGFIVAGISQRLTYSMRKSISEKINKLPLKFFDQNSHGDILSRATNDMDTISNTLNNSISQLLTSITTLIGVLIMMIRISILMTGVSFLIIPISFLLVGFIVKNSQKHYRNQQKYLGSVNGHVEEMYSGSNVIRAFNGEEKSTKIFDNLTDTLYKSSWKAQFFSSIMMPIMNFVGNLGYVAVSILGGVLAIKGSVTVGDIQAFLQYIRQFTQPIAQVSSIANTLQATMAAAERVFIFLEQDEEKETGSFEPNEDAIETFQGSVKFENVKFGYNDDNIIINNFSCDVESGKKIAIVGPTGAGKTTIVKLLMRFYELNGGAIYIDGMDSTKFTRNGLRSIFGMVLQDAWLFNGTIMENLRYGKLSASDEDVIKASKMAHVDHFIKTLPEGYNTILNEDATNISQGQKQLLTIARTFLANPKVLILDEATSSVDTRTEVMIQKAMENLMANRTSFVIAHRLSTIKDADLILVMKDGDIIEQGNHNDLLASGGFYEKLYNSQFDEEAV